MDVYRMVFEQIDMRSFSSLWFWIALAAIWSGVSHYVLGVPFDMVRSAARDGGRAATDLDTIVRIRARRLCHIARVAGLWLVGLGAMVLSVLATLGFRYGVELAQALFLIAMPLSAVALLAHRTARAIEADAPKGAALRGRLAWHRRVVQSIGLVSIFLTALWGMYRNLAAGPLGG